MTEALEPVVVAGTAPDAGAAAVPAALLWAALEDAGIVVSAAEPVVAFLTSPAPQLDGIAGLSVRLAADPTAAAEAAVRSGEVRFAVAAGPGRTPATVVTRPGSEPAPAAGGTPLSEQPFVPPLLVSGRTEAGLRAHARALSSTLEARADIRLSDAAYTLNASRVVWPRRVAVNAMDRENAITLLRELADGSTPVPAAGDAGPGVVFVYPGQGAQWTGMATELASVAPVFREALAECARELRPWTEFELNDALSGAIAMDRVEVIQPALFAVMVALTRLWNAHGVTPAAVVGHSFGEIAAVTAAGGLSVADGCRLVATVSKALAGLQGTGDMVAVAMSEPEITRRVTEWELDLAVAVVNGPRSTVVAGPSAAAAELKRRLEQQGERAWILPINIAGHTGHMEPIRDYLVSEVAAIQPRAAAVPVHSSTAPEPLETAGLDAEHWFDSLRETARFSRVTETLLHAGHRVFIEMSPHPVLTVSITETAAQAGRDVVVLDTMRRDDAGYDRFVRALADSQVHGTTPDWARVLAGAGRVALPAYRPDFDSADAAGPTLADRLRPLPPHERVAEVTRMVTGLLAGGVEPDRDFRSLGVDSVGALGLRNRLVELTGARLGVGLLFDHPTPSAVAGEVVRVLFDDAEDVPDEDLAPGDPQEAIAIVGMACRFPGGVESPDELWRLIVEGRDGVADFPADRGWDLVTLSDADPETPGTFYPRQAGMLTDVAGFDADFFGISPREALAMDPQQRLLLETSWAALEDGGIDGTGLKGSRTGVFTGIMSLPYGAPPHRARPDLEGYVVTGTLSSVASGRLSYALGLEGPAITLDTACSSALVALHLAVQALRRGEADLALAAGATVMAEPGLFIEFSRLRGLAPDGRSKPFSAEADGFGMAEGVGVLVVERLSDAQRLGHRVLAVVRGSAVNQDGASNGLTAPNGPAQRRVIRAALRDAGVEPGEVDLLEAHGTGTKVGDPIEAQALLATYGRNRVEGRPVHLGSVKSNVGHTQSAAGIAGVIKAVQAMRHQVLPRSLHAEQPTAEVDWSAGTVELLADNKQWTSAGHPRRAGVSAFGISGTNAHVILEEYETPACTTQPPAWVATAVPLTLSGKTPEAVRAQAHALRDHLLAHPELPLADVSYTLMHARSAFAHRATVVGDRDQLLRELGALESVPAGAGRVAGVFSGQGSQRTGMGHQLAADFPVFAGALDEVCAHLDPLLDRPLREVMWGQDDDLLARTEFAQPAIFAFEVALARLWQSWGVSFTALAGHSVGEIAAAVIAGVLTLNDAAKLVAARGRLMGALPTGGAMAAINAPAAEVAATLTGDATLAAVNAAQAVVVSGPGQDVDAIAELWRERGHRTTRLRVSHAFHSALMEPILADFTEVLAGLTFHAPATPISPSADTAHPIDSADYWVDHARKAVLFADAIDGLPEIDVLLEIGPDAALTPLLDNAIPSARRRQPETLALLTAAARAYDHGTPLTWRALHPTGSLVTLPHYAFQHERYWLSEPTPAGTTHGADTYAHPVLTERTDLPGSGGVVLTGRLDPGTDPWLAHHVVMDTVLLPGTGFVELALEAARAVGAGSVDELVLRAPMVFPAGRPREVQVWAGPAQDSGRELQLRTREPGGEWTLHAGGLLAAHRAGTADLPAGWTEPVWPPAGASKVPGGSFYPGLAARGYEYGPAFHGVQALWVRGNELFADVVLPEGQPTGFGIHPALLDAALHALPITGALYDGDDDVRLPFSFNGVSLLAADARQVRMRILVDEQAGTARAYATDVAGNPVLAMESLVIRSVQRSQLQAAGGVEPAAHFTVGWERLPLTAAASVPGSWRLIGDLPLAVTAMLTPSGDTPADGVLIAARTAEELLHALAEVGSDGPVWCVTTGATADDVAAAGVWGLGRVAALERPEQWGGLIDLPAEPDATTAGLLAAVLTADGGEDQVAIRDGAVHARRLSPAPASQPGGPWAPKGTVLITGGTGGLGGHVARRLATTGSADRLVLVSRRGPEAPGAIELRDELRAAGTDADVVALDITDRDAVTALLSTLEVSSVVHTAGVVSDIPIGELTAERLAAETAAKVEGALVLDELLPQLDTFVLFSSISGVWGAGGQAAYATGNAQLDALARRRRSRGQAATAVAWGPWLGGGMLTDRDERELRRLGLAPLAVDSALRSLDQAAGPGVTELVVANVNWPRFLPAFTAARPSPLLAGLAPAEVPAAPAAPGGSAVDRLTGLAPEQRRAALLELTLAQVAALIGQADPAAIDPARALKDLGFDSLMSVELRNKLMALFGIRLSATLVFDYPTPDELTDYLLAQLDLDDNSAAQVPLLTEYESVESKALSPFVDGATRAELARRLRWLLERLDRPDPAAPATIRADDLGSASAAELMSFLDSV
ncbi:type I polyketide synthase [Actinoplanes sp. TFC3]|uniref:type I polyketide synthase n=1 Tax=Actinoplanes sp. TFC3 TaxID=1710355 RepID=UPI000829769B|nr:type I polyketide synthase [Actinoplanes sp. TFC3]